MKITFVVKALELLPWGAGYRLVLSAQEPHRSDLVLTGPSHFVQGDLVIFPLREEAVGDFSVGQQVTVSLAPGAVPDAAELRARQRENPRTAWRRREIAQGAPTALLIEE